MNILRRIFASVETGYLVNAYVIGALFYALYLCMIWNVTAMPAAEAMPPTVIFGISAIVFPFSKLVWDELRRAFLGDMIFIANAFFMSGSVILINFLLFSFAIVIAPLGVLYLWFITKNDQPDEQGDLLGAE
ncbi:hypothetical protein MNBD_ALPHA07-1286 [hydrothermal vent metagenome]|uniref:Uncharacterized protein n=1 Tax=hydrothermal vent metagenome TaxID=652676 RepID=A0A3B0SWB6_9ZZZZ